MICISCQDALGEGGAAAAAVRSPQSGAGEEIPHRNWGVDLEMKVHPKVLNSLLPRIDIEIDKYLAQNFIVINF